MIIHPTSLPNLGILGIFVILCFFFAMQGRKVWVATQGQEAGRKPLVIFGVAYGIYSLVVCLLGAFGSFSVVTTPPRFVVILVQMLLLLVLLPLGRIEGSLAFLRHLSPASLILVQSFRIPLEIVLVGLLHEKIIPPELSLHGRNFDILIGLLALPAGFLLWRKAKASLALGIAFNVLGLLSLVNILSIAIPSAPSTFRIYTTNFLPTYFPGILIILFVQIALILHILSLQQLFSLRRSAL